MPLRNRTGLAGRAVVIRSVQIQLMCGNDWNAVGRKRERRRV